MFATTENEYEPSVPWSQLCRHFKLHEILLATKNFDKTLVIGCGGFGKVYKGKIYNGPSRVTAAIKRLDAMSNQGASEFWAEVEMLSKLRHCHLVSLIGYCNHEAEMILVYEYMPKGTLADHLHKLDTTLSWCDRLKMCIGAARGLDYLHTGTGIEFGIIHRDVKSSNILLDESWEAKVSDFGLSKISPRNQPSTHVSTLVKGTFGYFDPNYFATGNLTTKSDVYAFGVILLEVLCRRRAVDDTLECGLATWGQDSIKEGRLKDIVDNDLRGEISPKCLKLFGRIVERCLENHPKHRPTMAEVVLSLGYVLNLQDKTNTMSQVAGKTIFGRMIDKFSFADNDQNSGMDFESLMPKKPHIGMDFGPLMSKKRKQLMLRQKFFQQNGALSLEDKQQNGVGSINIFRAEEMKKATMNFAEDMIIGKGGSGNVYKGILPDNLIVAIKRFKISDETPMEYLINEIVILGKINHRNVVQLLGCCLETEIPLIAYEFVSNASLYDLIHKNTSSAGKLSWDIRLRIAHESAGALAYLHSDASMTIIHRDIKSSNILLGDNYTTKIVDFGISRSMQLGGDHLIARVKGTFGYLDPEYFMSMQLTEKSDVYSFGVVLAELLTGLKVVTDKYHEPVSTLATDFVNAKKENRLHEIVDRHVLDEATDEQLEAACSLVCRCLDLIGWNRPSMKEVTMELERIRKFSRYPLVSQTIDDNMSSLTIESEDVFPSTASETFTM